MKWLVMFSLSMTIYGNAYADSLTLPGGVVHFSGMVTDGACAVARDSEDNNVTMGQVKNSSFKELGDWADPVSFSIVLIDCSAAVSQQVGVMMSGVADGKDPLVFRAGTGANAATGIGIGVFDSSDSLIIPNARPRHFTTIQNGTVVIPLTAKYRSTSRTVKAGDAGAVVYFSLLYP